MAKCRQSTIECVWTLDIFLLGCVCHLLDLLKFYMGYVYMVYGIASWNKSLIEYSVRMKLTVNRE